MVDDLLATGGSLRAAEELAESAELNTILAFCPFELSDLKGSSKLKIGSKNVLSLIKLKDWIKDLS